METTALQGAYQRLEASAAHTRFSLPSDENEWSVELVLAHIIATNQTLCIVGVQLLDGREATYEGGTLSVTSHWLRSIIEASENTEGLLAALRQSSGELLALAHRFDDDTAGKLFPATIYDGHGRILWDGPVSFQDLLNKKLVSHLSQHIEQIQALQNSR